MDFLIHKSSQEDYEMENVITMEMIEVACETYKSNWINNIEYEEIIGEEVEDEEKKTRGE